jgi:hypothetical protein
MDLKLLPILMVFILELDVVIMLAAVDLQITAQHLLQRLVKQVEIELMLLRVTHGKSIL